MQTHTKNMCNMFVARLRTLCRLPLPMSSPCCLLVCAASTQGSYSDDFTWHAIAWRPCYNSKSRARELASNPLKGEPLGDGTLQAANASARAVLHHPHPARYVGALSLCVARTRDLRGEQLAARSQEPARAGRISRDASASLCFRSQEFQHLGLETVCHSKNVLAGVRREISQKLVGRNFLNINLSALQRGPAGPTP